MTPRRAILLFTRSIASEIKAKRFSGLSYAQCQQVYRWLIQTAIAVSQQTHAALVIATDKPAPEFIGATHFLIQRGTTFHDRLCAAVEDTLAIGYEEVVIIGNDSPDLTADTLEQAFDALETQPIALGAALDGGLYLIGLQRTSLPLLNTLLASCRWQTQFVQEDLRCCLHALKQTAAWLPPLVDIDDSTSLLHYALVSHLDLLCKLATLLSQTQLNKDYYSYQTLPSVLIPRLRHQKAPPRLFI
ncbi:MAG: hypothetical protein CMR00_03560 [[Chlorobium] sp. 445]|nr:MAG: hypothetical protein CMR00_03560 [[Chlorobium] sp. 445]